MTDLQNFIESLTDVHIEQSGPDLEPCILGLETCDLEPCDLDNNTAQLSSNASQAIKKSYLCINYLLLCRRITIIQITKIFIFVQNCLSFSKKKPVQYI